MPGFLKAWAEEFLAPPEIHWSAKLSTAIASKRKFTRGSKTQTYRRESRRQEKGQPILPSRHSPVPVVALVGDTSASMGTDEITAIIGTAKGLVQATGAEVIFCAADTQVQGITEIRDWSEIQDLIVGRGGTDFRPAFKTLEEYRPQPSTVVYVTDGYGSAPADEPTWCETIWVLVGPHTQKPCHWGEVIEIEN